MIGAIAALVGAVALSRRHKRRHGFGAIPPEPSSQQWRAWAERTYADGTPVMVVAPSGAPSEVTRVLLDPAHDEYIEIHNGARGVANGLFSEWQRAVGIQIVDDRNKWGERNHAAIGKDVFVRSALLKPLADNWTAPQMPKSTPIPQRGWARQASASRGMRSRR